MNCEILRTLYIKANGEIVCNDDMGEQVSLAFPAYDRPRTGIVRALRNEKFAHIRTAFANGRVPWPGICEHCALLRHHEPADTDLLSDKVIEKLQVEASLACALRCPSCANGMQLKARKGPVHLPPEWFRKALAELAEEGFHVSWIEFCGQGEPLNHPEFAALVDIAREILPAARIRLVTNGNHRFLSKVGSAFIDETIVSIDGARQQSYAQYRVNGQFDKALRFLEASVDTQIPRGGRVIWKYILFACNDSDEELRAAQDLAAEIGVSRLWFVHGHGPMVSQRFTFQNAAAVPATHPFVKVESHPSYNSRSISLNEVGAMQKLDGLSADVWLDRIVLHGNGTVTLAGWANSSDVAFDRLLVSWDDSGPREIALQIARPDVVAAHAAYTRETCGFDVLLPAPGLFDAAPEATLEFRMIAGGTTTARFACTLARPGQQPA